MATYISLIESDPERDRISKAAKTARETGQNPALGRPCASRRPDYLKMQTAWALLAHLRRKLSFAPPTGGCWIYVVQAGLTALDFDLESFGLPKLVNPLPVIGQTGHRGAWCRDSACSYGHREYPQELLNDIFFDEDTERRWRQFVFEKGGSADILTVYDEENETLGGYGGDVEFGILSASLGVNILLFNARGTCMVEEDAPAITYFSGEPGSLGKEGCLTARQAFDKIGQFSRPFICVSQCLTDIPHFDALLPDSTMPEFLFPPHPVSSAGEKGKKRIRDENGTTEAADEKALADQQKPPAPPLEPWPSSSPDFEVTTFPCLLADLV